MKKPKRLRPGSKVAAVCLSSGIASTFPELYDWGRIQLAEKFELDLVPMTHTMLSPEELYERPELRVSDFYEAWERPDIDGVISVIGGEDSIRLLKHFDQSRLSRSHKVFVGMSDTTVTHLLLQRLGLNTFYGPAVLYGFADFGGLNPFTADAFRRAVMSGQPMGELKPYTGDCVAGASQWSQPNLMQLPPLRPTPPWRWIHGKGRHQGRLFGGCIEVICPIAANTGLWPLEPHFWDDKIIFLEYSHELANAEYTRWYLRSLAAQGVLARSKGLLMGRMHHSVPADEAAKIPETLLQVILHEERLDHLPVVVDMDFGHVLPMLTLPYGCLTEIDCDQQKIVVLEAATLD
ncbi:MAG TPA: S66 peptidase family protein [Oligoflexus sp.]|uniref:S66 family peptidase n=1 Tax=Oligoflexus sp. TaxID=1971216 RepID=UPI002D5D11ED|nr:S66 peptidase family protein [Oligoflexus sp.]HYX38562.1 S66 peptidase family protein [Oligoflexus sp.]